MVEQMLRFAFEHSAKDWWNREGKALGYCKPYCGGDGWWKTVRYVKS